MHVHSVREKVKTGEDGKLCWIENAMRKSQTTYGIKGKYAAHLQFLQSVLRFKSRSTAKLSPYFYLLQIHMVALFPRGTEMDLDTIFLLWLSVVSLCPLCPHPPPSTSSILTVAMLVKSQFVVTGASINHTDGAKVSNLRGTPIWNNAEVKED